MAAAPRGLYCLLLQGAQNIQLLPHSSLLKEFSQSRHLLKGQARKDLNYLAILIANGSCLKMQWQHLVGIPPFPSGALRSVPPGLTF